MEKRKIVLQSAIILLILFTAGCRENQKKDEPAVKKESVSMQTAPKDEAFFPSLDPKILLLKLFDNPKMDAYNIAAWKPDYSERNLFPVSDDGNCYTKVDTILYFDDHDGTRCAAVILATYYLDNEHHDIPSGNIGGSHYQGVNLGIGLFSEENAGWKLYKFEKQFAEFGYMGTYRTGREDAGKISLKIIGDRWTCLSLVQGEGGGSGVFSGYERLFSIERSDLNNQIKSDFDWHFEDQFLLSNILNYHYSESISFEPESDCEECYLQTTQMKIIEKKNDYYDIDLFVTRNGKTKIEHYVYNERLHKYIPGG